jgi:DNA polymerase-3 subunit gamma/tau
MLKLIQAQRLLPMEEILSGLAGQSGPKRTAPTATSTPRSTPSPAPPSPRPAAPAAPPLSPFAKSNQRPAEVSVASPIRNTPIATHSIPEHPKSFVTNGPEGFITGQDFSRAESMPPRIRALAPEAKATAPTTRLVETAVAVLDPPEDVLDEMELETTVEATPQIDASAAVAAPADDNIEPIRAAVVQSLTAGGHGTAATLVEDGKWTIEPSSVRIEVAAKATMIRLTFNAAAEKLIRAGLAQAGAPTRFTIVSGEALIGAGGPAKRSAPQGSVDAEARSNPLVLQAQSLFQAEIVSVIDLREK